MNKKDKKILIHIHNMLDNIRALMSSYDDKIINSLNYDASSEDIAELMDNLLESVSGGNGGDIGDILSYLVEDLKEYLEIRSI